MRNKEVSDAITEELRLLEVRESNAKVGGHRRTLGLEALSDERDALSRD